VSLKGQGAELLSATVARPVIASIAGHAAGKRGPGKEIHQLRKQQLASVHRRLQRTSLEPASRQFQIDTTQKCLQPSTHQAVAGSELAVNRTAVTIDMKRMKRFQQTLACRRFLRSFLLRPYLSKIACARARAFRG
jgi:hypothetical protein